MEEIKEIKLGYSGVGITSIILGIVGIFGLFLLSYISVVAGVIAIIDITKANRKGLWIGILGLVLGCLGVLANIGQYIFFK